MGKKRLTNDVKINIICADMPRLLNELSDHRIYVGDIQFEDDIAATINLPPKHIDLFCKIASHCGAEFKVQNSLSQRLFRSFMNRFVLLFGVIFLLLLSIYISGKILFIQVRGNDRVKTAQILDLAESSGLYFGADKAQVRSEIIKNTLTGQLPDLQWVGVNLSGCVATVEVKERIEQQPADDTVDISSIIAAKDGIVRSVSVVRGSLVCTTGQAVSKGDLLISAYTDYGEVTVVTGAEGEVFGDTINELRVNSPAKSIQKGNRMTSEIKLSIIFGKKLIKLYKDSGILEGSCDKIYKENNLCLPGSFELPVKLCVEEVIRYDTYFATCDQASWMADAGKAYITTRMISGTVTNTELTEGSDEQYLFCDLKLYCREMIGKIKKEEIFIFNGENNRTDR